MTKVTLSRLNQSGANEWADVEANDVALREVVNGGIDNENIKASAGIEASKLAANAKPSTWNTPKAIATEQTRESASFATLTTPDEITGVVVPENGLLVITYVAQVKCSVAAAGRVGLYIGATQMVEASLLETSFNRVATEPTALGRGLATATVTTGRPLQSLQIGELAAGTYAISAQFKATSGSVTAKERVLRVEVRGF